jgi:hypothetical protein
MTSRVDGDGFLILDGPDRRERPGCRALVLTLGAEESAALERASEHDLEVLEARVREDVAITLGLVTGR